MSVAALALDGQVTIVTGAAAGIGRGNAITLPQSRSASRLATSPGVTVPIDGWRAAG